MLCRYGPFWICTTLIFVAAAIGTFVTYVAHKIKSKDWEYDINVVQWSAGLFYGYVTIVPLVLYVILKYFSAPSGLVQLFCLYGYSLFVFIPALVSPWFSSVVLFNQIYYHKDVFWKGERFGCRRATLTPLSQKLMPIVSSSVCVDSGWEENFCQKLSRY